MIIKLSVTQQDIDEGEKASCTKCPVALALQRALGRQDDAAMVGMGMVNLFIDGNSHKVPDAVRDFVRSFDSGDKVEPFELTFSV